MRKLKADEIECRVAQVSAKGCSLLLYKTARTDATILTENYGELWQNDFKVIDGKMYGGIGVWNKELNQWIWRWDCGVESNTEAEKGQASDCFKRAGFKFLIGQELYKAPFIFVQLETIPKGNGKYELKDKFIKFEVSEIGYSDKGEINKLVIKDKSGDIVFNLGSYVKPKTKKTTAKKVSDKDLEFYEVITAIDNVEDLKEYYKNTCEQVDDREAYHQLVVDRQKAIKEGK